MKNMKGGHLCPLYDHLLRNGSKLGYISCNFVSNEGILFWKWVSKPINLHEIFLSVSMKVHWSYIFIENICISFIYDNWFLLSLYRLLKRIYMYFNLYLKYWKNKLETGKNRDVCHIQHRLFWIDIYFFSKKITTAMCFISRHRNSKISINYIVFLFQIDWKE